jgi:hypothetical protein
MTLVDRLEQLHAEAREAPWELKINGDGAYVNRGTYGVTAAYAKDGANPDLALIVELRNALPALLTALRAAHELTGRIDFGSDETWALVEKAQSALAPLFGEDTTP